MDKLRQRDYMFDNLKAFLIVMVVFGHLMERFAGQQNYFWTTVYTFIYSFHMPLFVFVSGYFSKNADKCRKNAFDGLFLVFILANFCWKLFMGLVNKDLNVMTEIINIFQPGWTLWYILSLFWWRLLLKDLRRVRFIFIIVLVLGIAAILIPNGSGYMAVRRTISFLPFFLAGFYMTPQRVAKLRSIKGARIIGVAVVAIVLVLCYANSRLELIPYDTFYHDKSYLSFDGIDRYKMMIYNAVTYFAAFVMIAALLMATPGKRRWYTKIGYNTLPAYLGHSYIVYLFMIVTKDIRLFHNQYFYTAVSAVLAVLIVLLLSWKPVRTFFTDVIAGFQRLILHRDVQREEGAL